MGLGETATARDLAPKCRMAAWSAPARQLNPLWSEQMKGFRMADQTEVQLLDYPMACLLERRKARSLLQPLVMMMDLTTTMEARLDYRLRPGLSDS